MKRIAAVLVGVLLVNNLLGAEAQIVRNERQPLPPAVGTATPYTPGAAMTPFMFGLAAPLQVPSERWDVGGLRLSILYGECQNFAGLDINGLVGRTRGHSDGLLISGIANIVNGDSTALAISPVNYMEGSFAGLQFGAVNVASDRPNAEAEAWQIGVFNSANYLRGFQLGVINYAHDLLGIQIGVVNIIRSKDVSFLPIINGYF